jgi:hypothetical protein
MDHFSTSRRFSENRSYPLPITLIGVVPVAGNKEAEKSGVKRRGEAPPAWQLVPMNLASAVKYTSREVNTRAHISSC